MRFRFSLRFCCFGFFQHDQGRTGHGLIAVPERATPGKAIDKIEFEFFAIRIDIQPVEIGAKVGLRKTVSFALLCSSIRGGGSSGCHLKSTVSRLRQVNGMALCSTPLSRRPPDFGVSPPHCLKKKWTPFAHRHP